MHDSTVKKTLIITVSIIAAVMLVLGAVAFGFNYMYKRMRENKVQQKVDKEAYEYTLLVYDEYRVVIIVDWDDDYYRIQRNDYPGELK